MGLSVALVLALIAFVVARADTRGQSGWCGHRWHHPGSLSRLAHELKLSDAEVAQIRTVWEAERPRLSVHIRELLAENQEMDALAVQKNPNESKVQEIASSEFAAIAALMVEKERLQWKMYGKVLNDEQ